MLPPVVLPNATFPSWLRFVFSKYYYHYHDYDYTTLPFCPHPPHEPLQTPPHSSKLLATSGTRSMTRARSSSTRAVAPCASWSSSMCPAMRPRGVKGTQQSAPRPAAASPSTLRRTRRGTFSPTFLKKAPAGDRHLVALPPELSPNISCISAAMRWTRDAGRRRRAFRRGSRLEGSPHSTGTV